MHYLLTGEGLDINAALRTVPLELRNKQLYYIGRWVDVFWEKATEEERAWLYVELQRVFPEFKKWIQEEEAELERSFNEFSNTEKPEGGDQ